MALRFRPVDGTFYDLFSEAARHLVTGAELLAEMLAETSDKEDVAKRMRAAEHAADVTTHNLIKKVNSTFITPFDREDIYSLGSSLDDVMDMMDEAVDLILLYEVKVLPPELAGQVDVLQRCAELTADAMPNLPDHLGGVGVPAVQQGVQDRGRRDGPRPDGEAEQDGEQQGDDGGSGRECASGQAWSGGCHRNQSGEREPGTARAGALRGKAWLSLCVAHEPLPGAHGLRHRALAPRRATSSAVTGVWIV